jgi:outer membrane protein assembly factor BamB
VYVDTVDTLLLVSSATGTFSGSVTIPATASPGTHYITAIGRKSGDAAQKAFTVSTNWSGFHFGTGRKGFNPYENVIDAANVSDLDIAWQATTGSYIFSSPAVANGVVYVGSYDDKLYAFALGAGNDAIYQRNMEPPAPNTLHPDLRLEPARSETAAANAESEP